MKYAGNNSLSRFWEKIKQYIDRNKPDLSNYVLKDDYARENHAGVVMVNASEGLETTMGVIHINPADETDIEQCESYRKALTPMFIPELANKIKALLNLATKDDLKSAGSSEKKILLYSGNLTSGTASMTSSVDLFEKIYVVVGIGGGDKVLEIFVEDFKNRLGIIWQVINETYQTIENNNVITICDHMNFNLYENEITISTNESFKNNSKLNYSAITIKKVYGIAKESI